MLCERHVEDEFRIGLAGDEEVTGGVAAGPVDEVAQRDVVARTLAHLDGFAVLHDGKHLVEDVFREELRDVEVLHARDGLQTGADARNRTVVIGSLNVDGFVEAAAPLVEVVSNVGHEVGERAVGLLHDAVLVVLEAVAEVVERSRA